MEKEEVTEEYGPDEEEDVDKEDDVVAIIAKEPSRSVVKLTAFEF